MCFGLWQKTKKACRKLLECVEFSIHAPCRQWRLPWIASRCLALAAAQPAIQLRANPSVMTGRLLLPFVAELSLQNRMPRLERWQCTKPTTLRYKGQCAQSWTPTIVNKGDNLIFIGAVDHKERFLGSLVQKQGRVLSLHEQSHLFESTTFLAIPKTHATLAQSSRQNSGLIKESCNPQLFHGFFKLERMLLKKYINFRNIQ